jgi:phospholipase C/alpha-toxin
MLKTMKLFLLCLTFVISLLFCTGNTCAWGGRDDNGTPEGTHPFVVESALNILEKDLSRQERANPDLTAVLNTLRQYLTDLKKGAVAPDYSDEELAYGKRNYRLYQDHFYDPDTRENYTIRTDSIVTASLTYVFETAQYRAAQNVAKALDQWRKQQRQEACGTLGEALHYFCDIAEPHHAANAISGTEEPDSLHGSFEYWVDNRINDPVYKVKTLGSTAGASYAHVMSYPYLADFLLAESDKAGRYAKNYYLNKFIKPAIPYSERAQLIEHCLSGKNPLEITGKYLTAEIVDNWHQVAVDNLANAQKATARVLYRFVKEAAKNEPAHQTTTKIHLSIKTRNDSFPYIHDYGTYNDVYFGVELYDGRVKEFYPGWHFPCSNTRQFDFVLEGDLACYATDIRKVWIRKQRGGKTPGLNDDWYPVSVRVEAVGGGGSLDYTQNINQWIKGNSGLISDVNSNTTYDLRAYPIHGQTQ